MSQKAIITDLNRCVGCLGCTVACKVVNGVPVGQYWVRTLRVGPVPKVEGGQFPDVDMYFLPMQCQHCTNPKCVEVCPTGASKKMEDGTVQIDKEACIGCQACVPACPYGVRYLNDELNVVEKCTLCTQLTEKGELPACVAQCGARARFYGDLDEGIDSFEGPWRPEHAGTYDEQQAVRVKIRDAIEDFQDDEMFHLADEGNAPQNIYILRNHYGDRRDREWRS
jgi:Fe-S-cluster-containing dehydrogenase component